jgi:16S rRNA (guanine1207-N2)-methyltransferase
MGIDRSGERVLHDFPFDALRRHPDVEAENLFAVDATDRFLLDEASPLLAAARPGDVAVLNDHYGALALGAAGLHGLSGIRASQDALTGELAILANAERLGLSDRVSMHPLSPELVRGARVVLMQLPKSLDALEEMVQVVARHADPGVVVLAGGRVKHLSRAMNAVLESCFSDVTATLARQKSRLLVARGVRDPLPGDRFPVRRTVPELGLEVSAHGAVFGGTALDIGTRFLLEFLDRMLPGAESAVDLGCGTGILAASIARARPDLRVVATDQSSAATESATETMALNGLQDRVTVLRDDAMAQLPDGSADLILCNPPFHIGTSVHTGPALKLFRSTARVLRPGGELWTVYNTPLGYQGYLRAHVGPTEIAGRNAKFTVAVSRRA